VSLAKGTRTSACSSARGDGASLPKQFVRHRSQGTEPEGRPCGRRISLSRLQLPTNRLDLPDALGDRAAAPGQDLSEAAFRALVIDAYRMGRLTEHELREVLDLPTRDAVDGFLQAHGVPLGPFCDLRAIRVIADNALAVLIRDAFPGAPSPLPTNV